MRTRANSETQPETSTPVKPLRADAQRNRDALLATAREAFTAGEFDLRIEEIARRAGVGIGTLYRHFETREALIEAVYREEVDVLCASVVELLGELPAEEALYAFLRQLVRHLLKNCGLATALMAVMAARSSTFARSNQQLVEALTVLMEAAVATGRIRPDVKPHTVMMVLSGICTTYGQSQWEEEAWAVLALLIDGLRYRG